MANPQQEIDTYLGPGWYKEWQEMDQEANDKEKRYYVSKRLLKLSLSSPLLDRLYDDLRVLFKIEKDYQQGMGIVSRGGRLVSVEQLKQVHDLYSLALGSADQENDILEALFATGFAAVWVIFPSHSCKRRPS